LSTYPTIVVIVAHLEQAGLSLLFHRQVGKEKGTPSALAQSNSKEIR
jgi:hypothetical protein